MPATASSPKVAPPRILGAKPQALTGDETEAPAGSGEAPFGSPAAIQAAKAAKAAAAATAATPFSAADGLPTALNPTLSVVAPGPVPVGVANFFIDNFDVPPFLLPIFQAAGAAYEVPWQVLAAINQIETNYGRDLSVSSAGAAGWMQFLPGTWKEYGVDANGAGVEDPYNPADAIFAAARYLQAAGASKNLRGAIFAYNHANWYVSSVMLRARLIGGLPAGLVSSVTGLAEGLFPVDAAARYADSATQAAAATTPAAAPATSPATPATPATGSARTAKPPADQPPVEIYAKAGAAVVAVKDGVVTATGGSPTLGKYLQLRDAAGNTYVYSHLKKLAVVYPALKAQVAAAAPKTVRSASLAPVPAPTSPATAGHQATKSTPASAAQTAGGGPVATDTASGPQRLFAYPTRPAAFAAGGSAQVARPAPADLSKYLTQTNGLTPGEVDLEPLRTGAHVLAGTVLGRIGVIGQAQAPHVGFQIRPAGAGSPEIDPKPLLDGWQLLQATSGDRSATASDGPLGPGAVNTTIDRILLLTKAQLQAQVLADPSIVIYPQGRQQIQAGLVDQRVLAGIEFLSASGLKPAVSAFSAGSVPSASAAAPPGTPAASAPAVAGDTPAAAALTQVDISAINAIPLLGHQGAGSIAETTIRQLLTLPGSFQPQEIVSASSEPTAANTVAMPDHADRISLSFAPSADADSGFGQLRDAVLTPPQWLDLTARLDAIGNPTVPLKPTTAAIPDP